MVRYYISPYSGTGAFDNPYRPAISDIGDDTIMNLWGLDHPDRQFYVVRCKASQAVHDAIINQNKATPISPLYSEGQEDINSPFSDIPVAERQTYKATLEYYGFDTDWITLSHTMKQVHHYLWMHTRMAQICHGSGDAVMKFIMKAGLSTTIGDLTPAQRTAARNWMQNKGYDVSWITNVTTIRQVVKFIADKQNPLFTFGDVSYGN